MMDAKARSKVRDDREITRLASLLFEHIEGQISRADTKAELTITADGVLAAAVTSLSRESPPALVAALVDEGATLATRLQAGALVLLFVALLISILSALLVVRPSLRHRERPTLLYFGQIARMRENEFVERFLGQSGDEALAAVLADIHTQAHIARRKYVGVAFSVSLLIVALALWVLSELFLAL
jgi:Family of unknown function (DUF5706)